MPSNKFTDARLIYTYSPEVRKHRRLMGGFAEEHRITVNRYLKWLRQIGAEYEVRLNVQGCYLVKSNISRNTDGH